MPYTPKIGDRFRISTAQLFASGIITKINRVNFTYETIYAPRPDYSEVMTLTLPISKLSAAAVFRDGQIIQPQNP